MDQDLLQSFLAHNGVEQGYLASLRGGELVVAKTHVQEARVWIKSGKLISLVKHTRYEHCLEHTHEFVEMVYMLSGESTHIVNGAKVVLRAGELLILNQHARQEILPCGEDDVAINFVILPEFFRATLGIMGDEDSTLRKFLFGCLQNENQAGGFLHFKVTDVLVIQNVIENLLWALANDMPNKRSINQYTMGVLFLHLLNHTDKASSGSKKDDLTLKILQYVEERYADGTLEELARILDYNVRWLSTNISRLTGHSYTQLQQQKRLKQAKFLLKTTSLPIAEIARQLGYSDTSHFHRLFRECTGCTPKEFRN
jgi:AraC-like DNA-binding protein/mannose-6-phosphate isomerase-like protein (cupin superfamily)